MGECDVYSRGDTIYVVSRSPTVRKLWLAVGPAFRVEAPEPEVVGLAVLDALGASHGALPTPTQEEGRKIERELYRFLGVRSWGDLVRTMACVAVREDGSEVIAERLKPGRGGGLERKGTPFPCSSGKAEDVGRIVLGALDVSEDQWGPSGPDGPTYTEEQFDVTIDGGKEEPPSDDDGR